MKNITKRDVLFFFAGILTILVIEALFDWEGAKKDFMDGFNGGSTRQEQTK